MSDGYLVPIRLIVLKNYTTQHFKITVYIKLMAHLLHSLSY